MKIKQYFEVQTSGSIATGEEIETLLVNLYKGMILRELKAINDRIYFVFEVPESDDDK